VSLQPFARPPHRQFMERLQNRHGFGFMAVSLGYFDTLMSLSAASTSSELSDGDLAASGIGRGYVRMSIGITGAYGICTAFVRYWCITGSPGHGADGVDGVCVVGNRLG
jgi:cystathionine beta-lyase/cystathionine gamma-synthase